mgnify:CR=1 FL=1
MKTLSAQNNKKISDFRPLAAIYVRVSTEDQAQHGYSLAAQEDAPKTYSNSIAY